MLNIELSCFSVYFPFQICRCKCGGLGGGSDTLKIKIKKNSIPMSFAGAFPIRECNSGSEEVSVSLDRLPLLTGQGSGNQWCGECFQFPEPTGDSRSSPLRSEVKEKSLEARCLPGTCLQSAFTFPPSLSYLCS